MAGGSLDPNAAMARKRRRLEKEYAPSGRTHSTSGGGLEGDSRCPSRMWRRVVVRCRETSAAACPRQFCDGLKSPAAPPSRARPRSEPSFCLACHSPSTPALRPSSAIVVAANSRAREHVAHPMTCHPAAPPHRANSDTATGKTARDGERALYASARRKTVLPSSAVGDSQSIA